MTMQQTGFQRALPLVFIAGAMVAALVFFTAMAAFAMTRGDWGMGGWGTNDHMQRMMGGGTNSSNASLSIGSKTESVAIRDFTFAPGNLQIPIGATVTWTNYDDAPHTATAKDGGWDTGILNKNEKKAITFDKAGAYEYYCTVHPNMIARLTVR
jgi:plastocyanin